MLTLAVCSQDNFIYSPVKQNAASFSFAFCIKKKKKKKPEQLNMQHQQ